MAAKKSQAMIPRACSRRKLDQRLHAFRLPLPCIKGVVPDRDRANRFFALVGPPAGESHVSNNRVFIPSATAYRRVGARS